MKNFACMTRLWVMYCPDHHHLYDQVMTNNAVLLELWLALLSATNQHNMDMSINI
jgi:hypothetical protein